MEVSEPHATTRAAVMHRDGVEAATRGADAGKPHATAVIETVITEREEEECMVSSSVEPSRPDSQSKQARDALRNERVTTRAGSIVKSHPVNSTVAAGALSMLTLVKVEAKVGTV